MHIQCHRKPLVHLQQALARKKVTLGFIGGSITDARSRHNWPEPVAAWFAEHYPDVRLCIENAAIGATNSDLGTFRAEHDLIARDCDIVFVEYAVNDMWMEPDMRMRTREALLRKLLADGKRDVVITYTYAQEFYKDMIENRMPQSIADFEVLAEHYELGSVWMSLHALNEVRAGQMDWETWLPDGLHPTYRGSLSYGQSVITYLAKELSSDHSHATVTSSSLVSKTSEYTLPVAYHQSNWEKSYALPFDQVKLEGPWTIRRWPHLEWIDQAIHTSAVGAKLSFDFTGNGLMLAFDFGQASGEFRYSLNGQPWTLANRDRPDWCGDHGWYRTTKIADDLPYGKHHFELEVIHGDGPNCKGTHMSLGLIGVVVHHSHR